MAVDVVLGLSGYLNVCMFVCLSVFLSVYLSVCLSVFGLTVCQTAEATSICFKNDYVTGILLNVNLKTNHFEIQLHK